MNKNSLSRQEQAYETVTHTFLKLLERDKRISYEHKRSVLAFYKDMFAHEGVRNNMILAFSGFLWNIDKKIDASRKSGMIQIRDMFDNQVIDSDNIKKLLLSMIDEQISIENSIEETIGDIETTNLTEVGGGDEDDTPLI